jgi:hypothetical protein
MRTAALIVVVSSIALAATGQRTVPRRDVRRVLSTGVPHYSIKATNLLQAAAQIASDFNLPIGMEWQGDPDAKKEIVYHWQDTTVERILYDVATFDVQYQVEVSNGVVHLREVTSVDSARNPLNVAVPEFSVSNVHVGQARFKLQELVNGIILPPQKNNGSASGGSYGAGAGDTLISLSMKNATMREILDALLIRSGFVMWLVVFGHQQPDSGYWKTTPPWRKTWDDQQPDIDFVTRYHDSTTNQFRGDWKAGVGNFN